MAITFQNNATTSFGRKEHDELGMHRGVRDVQEIFAGDLPHSKPESD